MLHLRKLTQGYTHKVISFNSFSIQNILNRYFITYLLEYVLKVSRL